MVARGSARSLDSCRSGCPRDCPCELPKRGLQSQQEPSRPIGEAKETEGFTRKIEDGREAGFRLGSESLNSDRPAGGAPRPPRFLLALAEFKNPLCATGRDGL